MNEVFRHRQLPDSWSLTEIEGMAALDSMVTNKPNLLRIFSTLASSASQLYL